MPLALPALSRAVKLQKRATTIGFDWPNAKGALAKLKEEVLELEELIEQAEQQQDLPANFPQRGEDDMGDVFFSAINVARKMSVNSEQSLRHANKKFVTRVDAVIEKLQQQAPESVDGDELSNTSAVNGKVDSEMLNDLWNAVKREEKPS